MLSRSFLLAIPFLAIILSCKKSKNEPNPPPVNNPAIAFAKGADVSWLTQMESEGVKFYDNGGNQSDCLQLLKSLGLTAIRLRAWVDPSSTGGWCNTADVVSKALRAKNLGMKILLDFHYSDWWADPGQQNKPASWASQDFNTLKTSLHDYTVDVMSALKSNGIVPDWVQVGNETNDGMLWPEGRASTSMSQFAQLINAGYDAIKSVSDTTKVIVHISNGFDNSLFRWIFDGLKNNGGKWDVIGLSLYPSASNWATLTTQCLANMNDMITRYGKEIMVCEVGMSWDQSAACKAFLADLIAKTKSLPNNKGLGVFYWEPECFVNWNGYTLGAFDNSAKPTEALNAFK